MTKLSLLVNETGWWRYFYHFQIAVYFIVNGFFFLITNKIKKKMKTVESIHTVFKIVFNSFLVTLALICFVNFFSSFFFLFCCFKKKNNNSPKLKSLSRFSFFSPSSYRHVQYVFSYFHWAMKKTNKVHHSVKAFLFLSLTHVIDEKEIIYIKL